jgi:hypothetical protein
MRDLAGAVGYAKQQVGRHAMHGLCQGLSRTTIGAPAFGRSASIAWEMCRDRGWGVRVDADTVIPAGSIVYYSSRVGYSGHDASVGHATFCVRAGTVETAVVVSNDVGPHKEIGAVHPRWFRLHWNMRVRGYIVRCPFGRLPIKSSDRPGQEAEDTVGQHGGEGRRHGSGDPHVSEGPAVHLENLVPGASNPDVVILQKALIRHRFGIPAGPTGNYRDQTRSAVKAAQHAQGFTGKDADGAIGRKTCLFLGLTLVGDRDLDAPDVPRELLPELVGVPDGQAGEFWSEARSATVEADQPPSSVQ